MNVMYLSKCILHVLARAGRSALLEKLLYESVVVSAETLARGTRIATIVCPLLKGTSIARPPRFNDHPGKRGRKDTGARGRVVISFLVNFYG